MTFLRSHARMQQIWDGTLRGHALTPLSSPGSLRPSPTACPSPVPSPTPPCHGRGTADGASWSWTWMTWPKEAGSPVGWHEGIC